MIERSEAERWSGYRGDYDLACAVEGVLGVVATPSMPSSAEALVIGDEPLSTTFLPERNVVLQWIHAASEEELISAVLASDFAAIAWEDGPEISLDGDIVIFDAALPWDEVSGEDVLNFGLPKGRYRTLTADVDLHTENAARLHLLTAVE